MNIGHQDEAYKRGLVLGLTMAEIVILVLFTLLLLLGAILQRNREEIAAQAEKIEQQTAQIERHAAEIDSYVELISRMTPDSEVDPDDLALVAALKDYWERYAPDDVKPRDYFSQLVLQVEELEKLRARLEELVERQRQMEVAAAEAERLRQELTTENEQLRQEMAAQAEMLNQETDGLLASMHVLREEVSRLEEAVSEADSMKQELVAENEQLLQEMKAQAEMLNQEIDSLGASLDELRETAAAMEEAVAEAERAKEEMTAEAERLDQEVAGLHDDLNALEDEKAQLEEELGSLTEKTAFMEGLGIDLEAEESLQSLLSALSLVSEAEASGTDFDEMFGVINDLEGEVGDLRKLVAFYERRFGYPPCWHDGDFRIDYTFDVKFTSAGYVLRRVDQPRHADHPVMPLVMSVNTGREIPTSAFAEQTRPIFDWSVANECRFYVTVYDSTAEDEKRIYQERMRALEGHFYKLERVNEPAPF